MTGQHLEAESRFRIMADAAPVMMWVADSSADCVWFNASWLRFTGRSLQSKTGHGWKQCVHADDLERCVSAYHTAFDARLPFSMEYRLLRHDGTWRQVMDHGVPIIDADSRFTGYVGSCIDVHEDRAREILVSDLLRDRDVLLREVHHRVKNNFQMVMSMIGLRYNHLEAQSVEGVVLRELQARIGIMAAIQEELVSQPHADRIDFASQLRRLMETMHDGTQVEVNAEIEALEMPVDRALSLGLIATELLSNVYKHAFRGRGTDGRLWVSLRSIGGMVVLTLRDDGPGIPPPEARPRSVGLQIVEALAAQGDGEVEVDTAPGSTVRVRMKALA